MTGSGGKRLVKVCGAVAEREVDLVASCSVDLLGLWYDVDHPRDVDRPHLDSLIEHTSRRGMTPVVVTLGSDLDSLSSLLDAVPDLWLQLHGYQMPTLVDRLKTRHPDATVVKVLHLGPAGFVEKPFVGRYARAGVDAFLLDSTSPAGRVGSTGSAICPKAARAMMNELTSPVLLAGGLNDANRGTYDGVCDHRRYLGADFDTAARDRLGQLDRAAIIRLSQAWR